MLKRMVTVTILMLFLSHGQTIYGQVLNSMEIDEFIDSLDFNNIDEVISDSTSNQSFSLGDYVWRVVKGDASLSFSSIWDVIKNAIKNEFSGSISILMKLLTIAVISAIFTNFSHTFSESQVAETAYFVTYILMMGILTASYVTAAELSRKVLGNLLDFMKVMVPVYSTSIVLCAGASTSVVFYQGVMMLITLVDFFLIKIILPLINIYIMAMFANYLTKEDVLSKFAELIGTLIDWLLKTVLALVIGIGTIQAMIAPAIDNVKTSAVIKWAQAIPGIGAILGGVTETVLGAGSLLKNAIGAGGVIAVVVILSVPLVRLLIYALIYKAGAALIQPVADKRIISSVQSCVEGTLMLLKTVFVAGILFLMVIVMAAVSTTMYM